MIKSQAKIISEKSSYVISSEQKYSNKHSNPKSN